MADNLDDHGPDDPHPHPASHPEGDFPANFFDDVAPEHSNDVAPERSDDFSSLGHDQGPDRPATPLPPPSESRPVPKLPAAPKPTHQPYPPEEKRAGPPVFPILLGVVLLGALVAAVVMNRRDKQTPAASPGASQAPASAPVPAATAETPAAPAPSEAVAAEVKQIRSQVDGLVAQLKGVSEKVDAQPKPEPAPDLKPIHDKVDDLAKSVATVDALSGKVSKLDGRVGEVDGAVKAVKDEVSGLAGEVKKLTAALADSRAKPPTSPAEAKPADDAPALSEGTDLFKAGKFKEAGEVFKKIEAANPKDARVYYYEALVNGLTTNDWQNETLKIAARGAELEKSGATKSADVDAAFAGLPDNLKPWLNYFRRQAR